VHIAQNRKCNVSGAQQSKSRVEQGEAWCQRGRKRWSRSGRSRSGERAESAAHSPLPT